MDPKALADIDRQIAQLKKELSALFSKRISILQGEIKRSEAEAQALSMGMSLTSSSPAKGRNARQIKPVPAREEPLPGQNEGSPESVAPPPEPAPQQKEPEPGPEQPARGRAAAGAGETSILDALREAGLFGLTQAELSTKTGLGSQALSKRLKDLPGISKKGSGREARYYLKS